MLISPFHYLIILLVITGFILQYFYHLGYLSNFISCWTEMTDMLLVKACIHFFFGPVKVYRKYPWKLLESSFKDNPPPFFFFTAFASSKWGNLKVWTHCIWIKPQESTGQSLASAVSEEYCHSLSYHFLRTALQFLLQIGNLNAGFFLNSQLFGDLSWLSQCVIKMVSNR